MQIHAIKAFDDNYIWTLVNGDQAIVIDAGDATPVLKFLQVNQLTLVALLITHHHHDHSGGASELLAAYPKAQLIAHQAHGVAQTVSVDEGDVLNFEGFGEFQVWRTAGHTDTHLSYVAKFADDVRQHVFCGDALFSGGCGRVFTGTLDELHASLRRLASLPDDTLFYPAHEYTLGNLRFGLAFAEQPQDIQAAITRTQDSLAKGVPSLPTSLKNERKINVFLQACQDDVSADLAQKVAERANKAGLKMADLSSLSVFSALRELKNKA
ncbi:hydroxyacylglutathione hydrolase [Moraxella caviae]|uniref:Hydroxyacylglutathione hydrolase n=1 Tax=Moraxella caviae TaxID=34060 RepID=A0A1T0A324_9GAMM|nr:hydroxyacylglutathione hydrolase [Moraxella caviae]OOR90107.1 hydroxyacylglutathione hydrolase [Moraxella caviae]STZ14730.1 Hydroxyacylglutathione hydrolase [Moraxella caviae]VEW14028.1 Hydroxyacylglutathione hydrolase [Moraxella caviae]